MLELYRNIRGSSNKKLIKKGSLKLKSTGIIRNIDEVGRIVIPKEMRTNMNMSSSDPIEIYVEGDKIILTKYVDSCIFCGSKDDLFEFKGKKACQTCIEELKR